MLGVKTRKWRQEGRKKETKRKKKEKKVYTRLKYDGNLEKSERKWRQG